MTQHRFTVKAVALGALVAVAAAAPAMPLGKGRDVRIAIERVLDSPTLTVRYSGANVALVELRVNGESFATRAITAGKSAGETNFDLATKDLRDGDNDVEIRLYDRTGKLVGSEKVNVSTAQSDTGVVYLASPKVGQTLMGPAEIKVGFGASMKSSFVSFFVDDNFKAMTNLPPFTFLWDTTRETNGWHEVEAWAVDEASTTFKTKKVRVFVNNPGGRTDRLGVQTPERPLSRPVTRVQILETEAPLRRAVTKTPGKAVLGAKSLAPTVQPRPDYVAVGVPVANRVRVTGVGASAGLKPAPLAGAIGTGVRSLTPTGKRLAPLPKPVIAVVPIVKPAVKPVVKAAPAVKPTVRTGEISIAVRDPKVPQVISVTGTTTLPASALTTLTRGSRLPNYASFSILLNNRFVDFDVAPRVDAGVPMTPFRHLFEHAGGKVKWESLTKSVAAEGMGRTVFLQIGDPLAKVNDLSFRLETAPYLDRGRTIVPLSFLSEALNVKVEFDKATRHVLITSGK